MQLIEKRASNISANDELKNQLKQGEHPTVVQYQMVKNQVLLINNKDQLEQLKNAAENLQPDHLGPMKERSALGDFPQTIIADLDVQTAKLENIQKRDRARLETSEPGAGKDALQEMINDRATIIADNKKFKERLNQGEHPTLVQLEMAQKSDGLVSTNQLEILKTAADKLQANQGVIKANAVAKNEVKPESQQVPDIQADKVQLDSLAPKLSKPPPTVLPLCL